MSESWIRILGTNNLELEQALASRRLELIKLGEFTEDNEKYLKAVDFLPVKKDLDLNQEELEKLRLLCQLYDVELRSSNFSSHRPLIGPIIIAFKRLVFPILKLFLKDYIRQQRQFNAACISAIASSLNRK